MVPAEAESAAAEELTLLEEDEGEGGGGGEGGAIGRCSVVASFKLYLLLGLIGLQEATVNVLSPRPARPESP